MDRLQAAFDRIKAITDEENKDVIISSMMNLAGQISKLGLGKRKPIGNTTLEEAKQEVINVYDRDKERTLELLGNLAHTFEVDDSYFDAEMEDDFSDIELQSEGLIERLDKLQEMEEMQLTVMLKMLITKYSKESVYEDVHNATESIDVLLRRLDSLLAFEVDENNLKSIYAYIDSIFIQSEASKRTKELDKQTKDAKVLDPSRKEHILPLKRGGVYWAFITRGVGHEESGHRPVLVISSQDVAEKTNKVIVLLCSSIKGRLKPSEVKIFPNYYTDPTKQFSKPTYVSVSDIITLDKARIEEQITELNDTGMSNIERRFLYNLGITEKGCKEYLKMIKK